MIVIVVILPITTIITVVILVVPLPDERKLPLGNERLRLLAQRGEKGRSAGVGHELLPTSVEVVEG